MTCFSQFLTYNKQWPTHSTKIRLSVFSPCSKKIGSEAPECTQVWTRLKTVEKQKKTETSIHNAKTLITK